MQTYAHRLLSLRLQLLDCRRNLTMIVTPKNCIIRNVIRLFAKKQVGKWLVYPVLVLWGNSLKVNVIP
jgi:hypothetical protein